MSFRPYNQQLPITMCNAYNHPPWCECRWGGDTRSGTGLGWIPAPAESSRPAWADLTAHKQRLGYETTCFFGCEKRVFFHRDENGGRVLLDFPLGRPWQVHPCWEIHRSEQRAALNQAVRELEDLNFNGVFYPPTGRLVKRPRKGEFEVNLDGYVADNHVLYKEPQVTSIRSAKKSTYVELVEIDVADSDGRLFRFLMPRSAAERIRDYELVHVHGFWLKKRRRWFLLAGEVTLEDGSHLA